MLLLLATVAVVAPVVIVAVAAPIRGDVTRQIRVDLNSDWLSGQRVQCMSAAQTIEEPGESRLWLYYWHPIQCSELVGHRLMSYYG